MKKVILIASVFFICFSCKNTPENDNKEDDFPTSKLDMITTLENADDTTSTSHEEAE
jgi:hypothetical protein